MLFLVSYTGVMSGSGPGRVSALLGLGLDAKGGTNGTDQWSVKDIALRRCALQEGRG